MMSWRVTFLVRIFVVLLALPAAWLSAEVIPVDGARNGMVLAEGDGGVEMLVVSVNEVRLSNLDIDGASWAVVQVPGGHNLMDKGRPSLPFLASEYLLGIADGMELQLESVRYTDVDLASRGFAGVAPSKGHFNRSVDPDSVPWTFDERIYGGDAAYPQTEAWVDSPYIAGPLRGQALRIPVVRWQPQENVLQVVEEARYRVVRVAQAANPRRGPQPAMTGLFDQIARIRTVNYDARYTPMVEIGRLLVLADDDFTDEVQPLVDWEMLVGYPTVLTPMSAVGTTATDVMTYIQSLYDQPEGLTYIILVGDYQQIPNFTGVNPDSAPCDACYTKLEGADNRPDAAISRLSGQTGNEIAVQVAKVLNYEQYPDEGSAAAWYSSAFGIGSDDEGGTGLADWERIDLLKVDLVEPAYTFTEFAEIYHDTSTSSQVTTALNAGTSLGMYIGHGWDSGWVTSSFDVADVHGLSNGSMLPVIWSVACNNGQFHDVNECFGEAWLRDDAGGAVSFEGGTTSESWVPPCNAQRGIIDAMRQEVAFTTGGQLVNGKLYCMDIDGDFNSDEGTKFMEQSTLFGSCVMWPRTVAPMIPDEPLDFVSSGGVASLTVTVGSAPYAKANGAIVSFYEGSGGTPVPMGSGLIDANGVVSAAVSGDPTHCHIHGFNLVPQSFELAARDEGRVSMDAEAYACDGLVTVRVSDSNVPGSSDSTVDTVDVSLSSGAGSYDFTLTELDVDRNIFSGAAVLGTDLAVSHGDILTVTYVDADDGAGGSNLDRIDTAAVDCAGPQISAVATVATAASVQLSFTTDEPGTTVVRYGSSLPPSLIAEEIALVTDHQLVISDLDPCSTYYFEVASADGLGNSTLDDNGGSYYTFATAGWQTFLEENLDSDPGWNIVNGSHLSDGWGFGVPTGAGQDSYGGPDPTSGATGSNVYGVNLAGDQPSYLLDNELQLTTPAVDLSEATEAQVSFKRWLGVEGDTYDNARVRVSTDGGSTWTTAWENDGSTIDDQAWVDQVVSLNAYVGSASVLIQWTMGESDSIWNYCGWNIDDIVVEGAVPCDPMVPEIFSDDFESSDCSRWSGAIGLSK